MPSPHRWFFRDDYVIIRMLIMLSGTGLIFVAIMVASAVNRDRELGTYELFFSTPVSKLSYLSGRFAGSIILTFLTMIAAALGILVASLMPWQDPEHLVPFRLVPYVYALGIFVLPNVFLTDASINHTNQAAAYSDKCAASVNANMATGPPALLKAIAGCPKYSHFQRPLLALPATGIAAMAYVRHSGGRD